MRAAIWGFVRIGLGLLFAVSTVEAQPLVDFARNLENTVLQTGIPDTTIFRPEYDFIIVGAGSGGAVVANRLSESSNVSVLLLEAGDHDSFLSDVPLTAALTQITRYNWGYKSEPTPNACQGLIGGVCNWPKGKGIGGTSLINFMLYTRGHRKDYDKWAAMGNKGWSFKDVLPYFKKSENIGIAELSESPYHGKGGPLDVQYSGYKSKLMKSFLRSGLELGYNVTDPNGEMLMGFSRPQANIRNGRRCSTGKAFIRPIINRRNLYISMKSRVTKILTNSVTKEIKGVEFVKNKKRYAIRAKKEVILSAGAIASPQLLMLSGIGPKEDLINLKIPVIQNLRVGYNLQDHITMNGLTFLVNQSITINDMKVMNPRNIFEYIIQGRGPYTVPGGAEAYAFIRTPNSTTDLDYPNMELVLGAGGLNGDTMGSMRDLLGIPDEFYNKVFGKIAGLEAYGIVPVLLRPKSKGRISLRTKNPYHWPRMEPNFMDHPDDVTAMIQGIEKILEVVDSNAMRKLGSRLHSTPLLGCENHIFKSEPYWRCCLRRYGSSLQHQSGTCKMGPRIDPNSVVNPQLQVHGIKGLRVVDASVIPEIPAGHTNAIVIMIAEKASDMIKAYWRI